jgi:hypothetical protein
MTSGADRFSVLDVIVVQTYFVRRRPTDEPFFEIQVAPSRERWGESKTPRSVFLTRDEALYETALVLEASEERVDLAWKPGRRQNGQVAQLLVAVRPHREAA